MMVSASKLTARQTEARPIVFRLSNSDQRARIVISSDEPGSNRHYLDPNHCCRCASFQFLSSEALIATRHDDVLSRGSNHYRRAMASAAPSSGSGSRRVQ